MPFNNYDFKKYLGLWSLLTIHCIFAPTNNETYNIEDKIEQSEQQLGQPRTKRVGSRNKRSSKLRCFRAINERCEAEKRNQEEIARLWGQLLALVEQEKQERLASIAALKRQEQELRNYQNED